MERLLILGYDDAGEVLTLQRAAYVTEAQTYSDPDLPPLQQSLADLRIELVDREVLPAGLRDDSGRLVAAVRAQTPRDGAPTSEIGRLAVAPDRQGHGLGSRLLTAVEQQLPEHITELRLFTGEHSAANLRLYARLGYTETHREPTPAGYALVHLCKTRATFASSSVR